ncbi:WhiB family transcriptional regulator [Thermomonospora umbrina]|uniref:Transcriptional regulator WhiB n=1 Tax=Thermomonospora umbrina TaxID=111806 RepID=A0A3D9T6P1_9ACTN|nr:WhiB family transcriptional regulator [Thermomonospora umbrina]REF00345.1 WhiB family redox-sensing transcriptional regulator [Thermomonospora umbrina]
MTARQTVRASIVAPPRPETSTLDYLTDVSAELAWQAHAACASADGEAFFPEKGGSVQYAQRVCAGCPVKAECLEYALDNAITFGVWGGKSEGQRRVLRRRARHEQEVAA